MSDRIILDDHQSVFELSSGARIHPKVRLEWFTDLDSLRDIEKGPTRPHRTMERGERVIRHRDTLHEVFPDEIFVFVDRQRHIFEHHSFLTEFILEIVIDDFTVVLCSYSGQHFSLGFWDTETVECVFYLIRNIIPILCITDTFRSGIIADVIEIQFCKIRSPLGQLFFVECLKTRESVFEHPVWFAILFPDLPDHSLR